MLLLLLQSLNGRENDWPLSGAGLWALELCSLQESVAAGCAPVPILPAVFLEGNANYPVMMESWSAAKALACSRRTQSKQSLGVPAALLPP